MLTTVKRERYQREYNHYTELLDKLLEAQMQLVSGGVKSYTIADRTLTRFDLSAIAKEILRCENRLSELEELLNGGARRKAVGIVPRDT